MFKQAGIGVKVAGGFAFLLILILVTNIMSYVDFNAVIRDSKISNEISMVEVALLEARRHEKNYIIRKDRKYIDDVKGQVEKIKKHAGGLKDQYREAAGQKRMEEIIAEAEKYQRSFLSYAELVEKQAEPDKKAEHDQRLEALEKEIIASARTVQKLANDAEAEIDKQMEADVSYAKGSLIFGTLLALVLGAGAALVIIRGITRTLNRLIAGLGEASDQVADASGQVATASQTLAEGASEQAAGLEETSSSIEELSSMTRQNAENSQQANRLMSDTAKVVEEANLAMKELILSMKEISQASEETAKIIKTIDEIAFQTNLLALNAAVEAARAGEAGAGFAVVADEVRNLAIRAAEAAKNTAGLIEGTVKSIKVGSDTVTKTEEAFGKVSLGAKKVGELLGEIAAASQEQAQGIEQISKAISEMDRVVQQNASSAEESASAAEELNGQAGLLKGHVAELVSLVRGNKGDIIYAEREPTFPVDRTEKTPSAARVPARPVSALAGRAKEVKPDQVIPLEKDEFKDF